jgi:AmmeMemoRadiSam system protein A
MSDRGEILLRLARETILRELLGTTVGTAEGDWLAVPGATFVTLTHIGKLRGCMGSLQAHRALRDDVQANALAAAFRDPRFMPLSASELDQLRVEVSLLSPTETLSFDSEADALAQLKPLQDGVILQFGRQRATFLPQVWEQLPQPEDFMAQLKRKAGLPSGFWSDAIRLERYRVQKWREQDD